MSTVLLHSCSNPYESRSREVARYLTFFYRRTPLDLSPPHGASGCIRQPVRTYRLLQLPFRHFHLPETCVEAFADSRRPSCGSYWRMNEIMPPCLGTTSFLADRGYDAGEPSRCNARSRKGAIIMSITSWVLVPNDETCRLFWLPQNSLSHQTTPCLTSFATYSVPNVRKYGVLQRHGRKAPVLPHPSIHHPGRF